MIKKCEISSCNIDIFGTETKCILHCDKTINNNWILDKIKPQELHKAKSSTDNIMHWNKKYINFFWDVLFDEIKNKIIINVKKGQCNTTNEAIRIVGTNKKDGFMLYFCEVKFPPITDLLSKYISSNNNIIRNNTFQNCTFYDNCIINIHDSEIINDITQININELSQNRPNYFYNCDFKHNIIILRPYSTHESINIDNCNIEKIIQLDSNFKDITISETKASGLCIKSSQKCSINSLSLINNDIKKITLKNIKNDKLDIRKINSHKVLLQNSEFKKIYIKDIEVNVFSLFNIDFLEHSKILFENLKTKIFKIERLSQDSKYIQLYNIDVYQKFKCDRVEFKNTYFNSFNIKDANKEIKKTSFIGSHLNSIQWGKIFEIKSTKDIFRQLKFVNDRQGNYIEANNFYATEMNTHKNEILDKESWFSNYWQEKLTFLLAKKISNFGQSWFLPFLWLMIINLSFYAYIKINFTLIHTMTSLIIIIILFIIGRMFYEISKKKKVSFYIAQHFTFILILSLIWYFELGTIQDISKFISFNLPKENTLTYTYLHIWFLNKTISSFILYYFVVALRRQTRR